MLQAFVSKRIFDGRQFTSGALLCDGGRIVGLVPHPPENVPVTALDSGILAPGFVDLQVNGGGGLMLNAAPEVATLAAMSRALVGRGTTSFLPTLITDRPDVTLRAIDAVIAALREGVPGVIGLHLEGPHLSVARKGAHDPALIRPMSETDLQALLGASRRITRLMVTVAPESVTLTQIAALRNAGITVSLGHTDCDYATAKAAVGAGATVATHLFNAMSQLTGREPGLVGAALALGGLSAGLIADGIHVHPAAMRLAIAGKAAPGRIFLVTDAMATAGSDITEFMLNGRSIHRRNGRLTLADGTLAGADLDMPRALRVLTRDCDVPLPDALAMATRVPSELIGLRAGSLDAGLPADLVHLTDGLELAGVWRGGEPQPLSVPSG